MSYSTNDDELTLSVTLTEEDVDALELIPKHYDTSGIIAHILELYYDNIPFEV